MDKNNILNITSQVIKRFPEMNGCTPQVQTLQAKSFSNEATYVITYQGSAKLAEGKSIPRHVRVIADGQGNIFRISTSR